MYTYIQVSITTQNNELMWEVEREELRMRLDQVISALKRVRPLKGVHAHI